MKKILSIAFVIATILNALGNAAFAQNNVITWFESLDNIKGLESYAMQQVVTGDFATKADTGDGGSGDFKLNIKSAILNHDRLTMDSKHTIDGKLHFSLKGEGRPFSEVDANFRLSVIALESQGAYVRLENLDFNANGISEEDMPSYLDFREEFKGVVEPIKWQWIQLPDQYIKGQLDQGAPAELSMLDTETLKNDLVENGFRVAIQAAIEDGIATAENEGSMTEEDAAKARALSDRFFETNFFNLKTSARPGKEEQTSFILNKGRIIDFVKKAGEELGKGLSESDLTELRSALGKFNLSGAFHQNSEFGIFDRLKIRLQLKNIEELKNLKLDYSYKIGNINAVEAISAPAKFMPLEESGLDFLPPPAEPIDPSLDLELPPTDLEPLPTDGL